ncbi:hypothetical protein B1790_02920 [Mycobacterium sp. AT1]|nr:hypothetical protein B1790_02920 [Mycobacterium sp. AT1]
MWRLGALADGAELPFAQPQEWEQRGLWTKTSTRQVPTRSVHGNPGRIDGERTREESSQFFLRGRALDFARRPTLVFPLPRACLENLARAAFWALVGFLAMCHVLSGGSGRG